MKNKFIHSSAVVEPGAKVANDVIVGPFSYIGAEVTLHSGVEIKSHVVVTGMTEIDQETVIYPFAVIGEIPDFYDGQDILIYLLSIPLTQRNILDCEHIF